MATDTSDLALFSSRRARKRKAHPCGNLPAQRTATAQRTAPPATDAAPETERRESSTSQSDASTSVASTFQALGLGEHLHNVCASLGMKTPTPVQAAVVPEALKGRDCIGVAKTGSGKTAAFLLPILHGLARERYGVYALVLTPTRELAYQIAEQVHALGRSVAATSLTIVGGMDQHAQALALRKRPHVVVATPGRLADMLAMAEDLRAGVRRIAVLVLDEADRLLEPSFEAPLRTVLQALPRKRQTLLFTATLAEPVDALRTGILRRPFLFTQHTGLDTADALCEEMALVPAKVKEVYLMHVLETLLPEWGVRSAMVFCGKRASCELVSGLLYQLGVAAVSLHSGKPQKARLAALHQFKSARVAILVATDVAARGLDIPTVDVVLNFDVPVSSEDYVHRVGRTARAGRGGRALTLVTQYDVALVKAIETGVGHELGVLALDEGAAMEGITRVFAARRAALLAIEGRAESRAR